MKRLLLPIMLLFALISGTVKAQTLTVCDGTTQNNYVPFYAYWGDMGNGPAGEFIYPASMLTDMASGSISAITFYNTGGDFSFTQNVRILMGTTTETTFASSSDMSEDGLTLVYEGPIAISNHQVDLSFDTPFTYSGDNLVVYVHLAKGSCTTGSTTHVWYGTETESITAVYKYGSSSTGTATFLPKATFTYTAGGTNPDLPEPEDIDNEYFYISASGWAMWAAAPTAYPEEGDECVIDAIDLTGFVEPADGESPSFNVTVNGTDCTIAYMDWNGDNGIMYEDDIFSFGGTYYMYFEIEPVGDCTFADDIYDMTITINGSESIVDNYGLTADGALWIYTIDYNLEETPDECIIETVAIYGFEEPVYGGTANTDGLYVESDQYEITYAAWYGYDAGELADGDTFGEDIYYLYVELTPTDGCEIGDITFLVNDDENIPDLSYCGYDGSYGVFYVNSVDYELSPFPITFEDGTLGFLTTIDNDGDGYTFTPYQGGASYAHGGSWYARVRWNSSGNDDYLIIPVSPVDGDVLSFYAASENNSSYLETFSILVSTTTPEAASFTTTLSTHANIPNTWNEYTADLSDYAGQDIYVAIHCTSYDKFYLRIDDIDLTNAKKADVAKKGFKNLSGKQAIAHNSVNKTGMKARRSETAIPAFAKRNAWGVKANRSLTWDFDDSSMGDWTNIDADGDGYVWMIATETPGVYHNSGVDLSGTGHNGSYDFVTSGSFSNYTSSALTPDNYLVSPQLSITEDQNMFSFWASAQDATYAAEHFGVAVSTTSNTDASAFTMLQEWDMTAKSAASNMARKNVRSAVRGQTRQGGWYQYMVDLSDYVGQDVYVAIRHFDCTDMFMLNVDDIELSSPDMFVGYNVYLDGTLVAEGITDLDYYMQDAEEFSDGSEHTASIEAVYASGNTIAMTKAWTFQSGDHFTGAPNGLTVDVAGNNAALTWELPEAEPMPGDFYHDFAGEADGGFNILDANGDGTTWTFEDGYAQIYYADVNDDYLIFPQMQLGEGSVLSFASQASSSYPETFEVMVSTTGSDAADFTAIATETHTSYQEFEYDLAEYAGQTIYIAIHNISEDQYYQMVSYMSVTNVMMEASHIGAVVYRDGEIIAKLRDGDTSYDDTFEGDIPTYCISIIQNGAMSNGVYYALAEKQCVENVEPCVAPENITTTVDGTDVTVAWDGEASSYTLRYRVHSDDAPYYLYDFEDGIPEGFTTLDADGDGFNWYNHININDGHNHTTHSGDGIMASESYDNNGTGALNPDNWLITPQITLSGNVSFWYMGQDPSYADEHFSVYVSTTGTDTANFVQLGSETVATGEYQQFTASLAEYAGQQGYIAIRHHNVSDMFILNIDDLEIGTAPSDDEWTVVEGITDNEYLISGLLPNTLYDVEVEAFCGTATGEFTTGEDEPNPCVAPINLTIEAYGEYNNVILVWDFEDGIVPVGCNIYRSTDGEDYELIAQTEGTDASYLDEGLEPGTYYYQVTALHALPTGECESDPAIASETGENFVTITIEEPQPEECVAPYDLAATLEGNDAVLTWAYEAEAGENAVTYGFEDGTLGEWTNIDADGDGNAWYVLTTDDNIPGHNGSYGHATSASYLGAALTPDNYLVSPQVTISEENSMFSFWACGQDASWAGEHFGVAVSTTGNTDAADFTTLDEWDMTAKYNAAKAPATRAHGESKVQGTWYQYTIDLSAYMGQDIYVAIRHFNCTDMFRINVDDITFSGEVELNATFNIYRSEDGVDYELIAEGVEGLTYTDEDLDYGTYYYQVTAISETPDGEECESDPAMDVNEENDYVMVELIEPEFECVAPINIEATADGGTVTLTWGMDVAGEPEDVTYDFEEDPSWTLIDADGDGNNWFFSNSSSANNAHSGVGIMNSESYINYVGALTPDNWLVSPMITATANSAVTFWVEGQDPNYAAEHYAVYVSTTSNTDPSAFTAISDELVATGDWEEKTFDLGAYAGQGIYVALRHFNCTDMFRLNLDDVTFTNVVVAGESNALFNIYRSTDGVNYELIAEGVEGMSYTDEGLSDGEYYYQVTTVAYDVDGSVGCESDPGMDANNENNYVMVTIDGIEDFSSLINVYPNPTKANVNIEAEGLNNIVVFNALGQVVYEVNATDDHVVVNMSNFGAGVYMFNIITNNGTVVKRVTVTK